MVRSGIQEFLRQLLSRSPAADDNTANDSASLTDVAAACSTPTGRTSISFPDLRLPSGDGATPRSAPAPVNVPATPSRERVALLEHQRDTGSAAEQLSAEYELQSLTHLARFSSLLDRVQNARRQREVQVEEECNSAQSAFIAARVVRGKEALELRELLERAEERARERLRDRVLQQCNRHDQQALQGLEACKRFAETVLEDEVGVGQDALGRVTSKLWAKKTPTFTPDRKSLRPRAREALKPDHTWTPLFIGRQVRENDVPACEATAEWEELREYVPEPSTPPPSATYLAPEEESPAPPPAQGIQPTHLNLLHSFEVHFSNVEINREGQWRRLQDQYDSDLGLWREHFHALLATLETEFSSEAAPGYAINAFKAANKLDRASARETFSSAESWRARDLERLWDETMGAFTRYHNSFVSRLPDSRGGVKESSNHYFPPKLRPITQQGLHDWLQVHPESAGIAAPPLSIPIHREFSPPFSFSRLLRVPGVAKALPIASPRIQMRATFRDAQARREQRFEGAMAVFEAEFHDAQRKHESLLALELRSWRVQVETAERERRDEFASRMQTARDEWTVCRAQRAQYEDSLVREFEEEFSRSQVGREEYFRSCVQKVHDHFVGVVQELLPVGM